MTFSSNTLDSDSTHPNTYNLVGFSGCLHLWWITLLTLELLTLELLTPELLTPELCVTSVTMIQSPHKVSP